MRTRAIAAIAVAGGLLTGCAAAQIGHDFDLGTFSSRVEPGATRKADVRTWLGEPVSTGVDVEPGGQRYEQWTYYFGSGRPPGFRDAKFKLLQVKFDPAGVVRAYNWSGDRPTR